jgi:hypothetical protein
MANFGKWYQMVEHLAKENKVMGKKQAFLGKYCNFFKITNLGHWQ